MDKGEGVISTLVSALLPRLREEFFPDGIPELPEKPMGLEELAAFTGLSKSLLAELASAGEIPHYRARRRLLFSPSEVLAALHVPASEETQNGS